MKPRKIIIITGLSGAGKTSASMAFEDMNFYCVDNMPVSLLPHFLETEAAKLSSVSGFAFVMDLREKGFTSQHETVFKAVREKGYDLEILFLEAADDVILRRYSQTRRYHPLSEDNSLLSGIRAERRALAPLRQKADNFIDTSGYTIHQFKSIIFAIAQKSAAAYQLRIQILSFGFKYGIPLEADVLMDVRFLPNPYYIPELKAQTGLTPEVRTHVLDNPIASRFLEKYLDLLDYLIPLYKKEGKAYLTIAVGCTGGQHRSVAVAEALHDHLRNGAPEDIRLNITHRDIEQEKKSLPGKTAGGDATV